jgi:cytidylate kinase
MFTHHLSLSPTLSNVQAGLYGQQHDERLPHPATFVTISRQAGAGARTFAALLAERLNQIDPDERPWAAWDRELVEAAANEHHLSEATINSLELGPPRSAFKQFLADVIPPSKEARLDEYQIYRRVAATVHRLAEAGRAIVVGRGSVYATQDLPNGIHVRLIAPLKVRAARMARLLTISEADAIAEVHRLDRRRQEFHARYFHGPEPLTELFTVTIDTGAMTERQAVEAVIPMIYPDARSVRILKPEAALAAAGS